ncbi:hypothetical protein GCM10027176_64100 [Actinoallomurus bryophytorum]
MLAAVPKMRRPAAVSYWGAGPGSWPGLLAAVPKIRCAAAPPPSPAREPLPVRGRLAGRHRSLGTVPVHDRVCGPPSPAGETVSVRGRPEVRQPSPLGSRFRLVAGPDQHARPCPYGRERVPPPCHSREADTTVDTNVQSLP